MEESSNFNDIVAGPLTEETKEDWFENVKNYLISKDLWKVTSTSARPQRCRVKDYARWRRKNAAALHVMRISCGLHNLHHIRGVSEAKVAWDILNSTHHSPPPPSLTQGPPPPPPSLPQVANILNMLQQFSLDASASPSSSSMARLHSALHPQSPSSSESPVNDQRPPLHNSISRSSEIVRGIEDIDMGILYKAISDNDWSAAKEFIDLYPIVKDVEFGKSRGETPLHVAAKFGHVSIVEELVALVEPAYLEIYDASGNTPLIIAAGHSGVIPIAQCLIDKNSHALEIPIKGQKWLIPVQVAFHACLKEMGRFLYSATPLQVLTGNLDFGIRFLRTCIVTGELDLVLDLLRRRKELLFHVDDTNFATIDMIADHLPASIDKSQLRFWKQLAFWVYDYVQQDGENNGSHQGLGLLHRLISSINNLSVMKEICKMKQQNAQVDEILSLVCENVMFLDKKMKKWTAYALFVAARREKVEFLLRLTKANPELVSLVTLRQNYGLDSFGLKFYGHVFEIAVLRRSTKIFNLLRGFRFKHVVATTMSLYDVDLLRAAARLGPISYLNQISGAALQMQRELQWFKAAESMVNPAYRNLLIGESFNVFDLFKQNHRELRNEGERWMKDTASSCSVVGALIVTIMFAVAFTVPGGNHQESGHPIFLENKLFKVFLISDALSLFSSTTSVLTFLGILTSRYAEEDFLYSLPIKLIIGLSTLFLSIATMVVAFSVTIVIMLQHNSSSLRAFLPIAMLGGVPITVFVLLQFPLLVEVISSTYGPGIFKKKVVKWP